MEVAEQYKVIPVGAAKLDPYKTGDIRRLKAMKALANTPDMVRIGSWFKRKATTLWNCQDTLILFPILDNLEPEDMELMERYYTSDYQYLRRDVATLLNNWESELDRAREWGDKNPTATKDSEGWQQVVRERYKHMGEETLNKWTADWDSLPMSVQQDLQSTK